MAKQPEFKVVQTSWLTDADWVEINKLKRAYERGGQKAFWAAADKLGETDPFRWTNVVGAFFPNELREILKDEMAERDMTEEELRELLRKSERPAGKH